MKSHIIALAALAVMGFAGAAFAGEATAPTPMTDEQMDQVTAAGNPAPNTRFGVFTATAAGADRRFKISDNNSPIATKGSEHVPGDFLGAGACTASRSACPSLPPVGQ